MFTECFRICPLYSESVGVKDAKETEKKKIMHLLLVALLLSCARQLDATSVFACPDNFPCYCMRAEDEAHKVHCTTSGTDGSAFDITVQNSDLLRIQCVNTPDWSDFLLGANLRVGKVRDLHYVGCELPGPRHAKNVVDQLGIREVEKLKVEKLRGNVSRDDLEVFPKLKRLLLSNSAVGDVPVDLLYGLPQLAQLDLRNTQIKLPVTGFFKNSVSLVSLELGQNDLRDLQPGAFDGLDKLELLNLWSSNISTLRPGVFRGLSALASLDLKNNHLRSLPVDVFHDLPNLKIIDIGHNDFAELPADLFARNRGLRRVKLSRNRVNVTRLPEKFLGDHANLTVVSLERVGLVDVPENLFWGSDAIVELNMNRNYLTTLPANLLRDARSLHKFSLSFNDLRTLPDGLFENSGKLYALDLSRNHLSVVHRHMFVGLDALQELNMAQNDLKFIEADALFPLPKLRVAKFANNQLNLRTDIVGFFGPLSPFHECTDLEELYLSHNNVTEIFADWTVHHFRLRKLDLSYNYLDYLQTEDLQFVSNRVQVDLTHNEISLIDLSRLEFISGEDKSTSRKVVIDLNFNPIHCDCELYSLLRYTNAEMLPQALDFLSLKLQHLTCHGPEYMRGKRLLGLKAPELKCAHEDRKDSSDPCAKNGICECWLRPSDRSLILDCAGRNLTEAPAKINVDNSERVEVDLSGNLLRTAPSLTSDSYRMVRILNLSGNRIDSIDESLISPNLEILRLDGNELSHIDKSVLKKIANDSSINLLTLHDNPWSCDCDTVDLLHFVQKNHEFIRDNITCAGTNRSLSDLTTIEICTHDIRLYVIASSTIAIVSFLLAIFVAIYHRYNQQIKVWLYSKNCCLWLVSQEELDKDKIYDAFVSYAHQDQDFVIRHLVAKLEDGPRPYKICIHVRDWLVGDWIPAQIQRSVEESRRTLIVLSPHFMESVWGRLEFQAAHKKAMDDKCTRVVIVLYGDIDPARIGDPALRDYLKMNTFVRWGDPWFYQKLRYALPHKRGFPTKKKVMDEWFVDGRGKIVQVKVC